MKIKHIAGATALALLGANLAYADHAWGDYH